MFDEFLTKAEYPKLKESSLLNAIISIDQTNDSLRLDLEQLKELVIDSNQAHKLKLSDHKQQKKKEP